MIKIGVKHGRREFLKRLSAGLITSSAILPAIGRTQPASTSHEFIELLHEHQGSGTMEDERFWDFIRQQFPLKPELTYMNTGGLGPSPYMVIETMNRHLFALEEISEPGHELVDSVRHKAARFFNCDDDEIALTRNATEGMNLIARGLPLRRGDEVVMSTHEHPGGAIPWLAMANDIGIKVKLFEPGLTDADNLQRIEAQLSPRTKVVMISHITCTTGQLLPAKPLAELCHQKNIWLVLDGAQVPGMLPVDLHALECDFYTSSGHKWLCGPKGTGFLYVRKNMLDVWRANHVGAYSDQRYVLEQLSFVQQRTAKSTEYGTRSTPVVIGLGAAIDFFDAIGMDRVANRDRALATHLKDQLHQIRNVTLLTPEAPGQSGGIVTFRISGKLAKNSDYLSEMKQRFNIRLRPVGEHGLNAIRASLHIFNSLEQIDRLVAAVEQLASG